MLCPRLTVLLMFSSLCFFSGCVSANEFQLYDFCNPNPAHIEGAPIPGRETLRVATLNLFQPGADRDARTRGAAAALSALDPDVIFLQEVTFGANDDSTAKDIAKKLGYCGLANQGENAFHVRGEGVAILSRWPLAGVSARRFATRDEDSRQSLLATLRLRLPVSQVKFEWLLSTIHLSSALNDERDRLEQLTEFAWRIVSEMQGEVLVPGRSTLAKSHECDLEKLYVPAGSDVYYDQGMILGGDFNAPDNERAPRCLGKDSEDCPFVSSMADTFRVAHPALPGYTWDNRNPAAATAKEPDRRLDYIFVGKKACSSEQVATTVISSEIFLQDPVNGIRVSDHYGVLSTIALPRSLIP